MVVVINAVNNEFAAASGKNVNVSPDYSYFDHPPNSTKNLTITSNEGDPSPHTFSIGDTYDLSWEGNGGGRMMDDATVIRSDYVGPGQGAVVFEGKDTETGEPVQIVWSPDFDLEQWYWDNGGGPSSPNAFWTSDQNSAATYQTVCFALGTLIDTPNGPCAIEDLRTLDMVLTHDRGAQPILWTRQHSEDLTDKSESERPVLIRANALGPNRPSQDLIVSPQHRVLVGGHNQLCCRFREEVLVPAKSLTGLPGIRHMLGKHDITWVHFAFARHEVVTAQGCISESLLLGPMVLSTLSLAERRNLHRAYPFPSGKTAALNGPPARPCLTVGETRNRLRAQRLRDATHPEAAVHVCA